jgi:hypothetical protein
MLRNPANGCVNDIDSTQIADPPPMWAPEDGKANRAWLRTTQHRMNPKLFRGSAKKRSPIVFPKGTVAKCMGLKVPKAMSLQTLVPPEKVFDVVGKPCLAESILACNSDTSCSSHRDPEAETGTRLGSAKLLL